jgi:hypothetical protein
VVAVLVDVVEKGAHDPNGRLEPGIDGVELAGFGAAKELAKVADWDDLADALRARGHGTGTIYHLPELDR